MTDDDNTNTEDNPDPNPKRTTEDILLEKIISMTSKDPAKSQEIIIFLLRSVSRRIANLEKNFLAFQAETRNYRYERELKESESASLGSTRERLEKVIKDRFAWFYWLIDRVMPGIMIAIILALLKYLGLY